MIYPEKLRINGGRMCGDTVIPQKDFTLSWALSGEGKQSEYAVDIFYKDKKIFESGFVKSSGQNCNVSAFLLRSGFEYELSHRIRDTEGKESRSDGNLFRLALVEAWDAPWIASDTDFNDAVIYFGTGFVLEDKPVENAVLYVCGIGYHSVEISGNKVSENRLAPSVSDYNKRCYYEVIDVARFLKPGHNSIEIAVSQGWRRNLGIIRNM